MVGPPRGWTRAWQLPAVPFLVYWILWPHQPARAGLIGGPFFYLPVVYAPGTTGSLDSSTPWSEADQQPRARAWSPRGIAAAGGDGQELALF